MVYGLLALRPVLTRKWLPLHGRHLCEPRLRPEEVADLRRTLLSMRPLQLRLVERGSSFRQLLERTRMSEALEGLADAELPLVILAERLGHTEPCAFSHVVQSYFVKVVAVGTAVTCRPRTDLNLTLTRLAQEHFPSLKVRCARDMGNIIALRQIGMEAVERETFESALSLGSKALEKLGVGHHEARERADRFRRLNLEMLRKWSRSPRMRPSSSTTPTNGPTPY